MIAPRSPRTPAGLALALLLAGGPLAACGTAKDQGSTDAAPALAPVEAAAPPDASPAADASPSADASAASDGAPRPGLTFTGDAWADNWFALYLGDKLLVEDSVPITTERSFNKESFSFEGRYPMVLSFVLKDFKENDTGLEYIGKPNQQIGDGGFIFQLREAATGRLVKVSDETFRCMVVHRAPLDPSCEKDPNPTATCTHSMTPEPAGWKDASFDDSRWSAATLHTAAAVGPKDGYLEVSWEPAAKFIWSEDLKLDNTVLCRARVDAPR